MNSFSWILILWYIFPVVLLFACNLFASSFSITERWHIKYFDLAAPFLFIGLNEISQATYSRSIIPFLMISLVLLGIMIAVLHVYYDKEIQYKEFFKIFWRVIFLLTMVTYVLFIFLSIFHFL